MAPLSRNAPSHHLPAQTRHSAKWLSTSGLEPRQIRGCILHRVFFLPKKQVSRVLFNASSRRSLSVVICKISLVPSIDHNPTFSLPVTVGSKWVSYTCITINRASHIIHSMLSTNYIQLTLIIPYIRFQISKSSCCAFYTRRRHSLCLVSA